MYTPKNILITGGAGFIGRVVANYLVNKYNYKIIVLDIMDYCASISQLDNRILFIRGDICDKTLVDNILQTNNIDTIIHFAAQTHVDNSFNNSINFTKTNVLGTHILAQSAVEHNIKRFIHVSTDEVYGEQQRSDVTGCIEETMLNPTNPYAATKCGAEFIIKSYEKSYNLPAIITRSNNVYGYGQFPEKLIPCFIMKLLNNKVLPIHGSGEALRNFIYVDDEALCFDVILHYGEVNNIYNISGDNEYSVNQIAEILCKKFNVPLNVEHVTDRNFNDQRYFIENTKLKKLFESANQEFIQTNFDEGLDKTIEWYKQYGSTCWSVSF